MLAVDGSQHFGLDMWNSGSVLGKLSLTSRLCHKQSTSSFICQSSLIRRVSNWTAGTPRRKQQSALFITQSPNKVKCFCPSEAQKRWAKAESRSRWCRKCFIIEWWSTMVHSTAGTALAHLPCLVSSRTEPVIKRAVWNVQNVLEDMSTTETWLEIGR